MTKRNNITKTPQLIIESNLSKAWVMAVAQILDNSGSEISPLLISITGFSEDGKPVENIKVRQALDSLLKEKGFRNIENVAHTIFPQQIWNLCKNDREQLYKIYKNVFNRYKEMNKKDNQRGSYFDRLTQYGRGQLNGNQLEWIINQYNQRNNVRRSMLQASIFDPARDHLPIAQLQFPCLQQISFVPTDNGLILNAFYATQQLFDKAYGNYLGLSRLGAFMASQINMKLHAINISIGVAKLERITKNEINNSLLGNEILSLCNRHQYSLLDI